jgi:tryptophanyl-tRNA synthetase
VKGDESPMVLDPWGAEEIKDDKKLFLEFGLSGKMHFGHKMIVDLVLHLKKLGGKVFFCIADIDAYTSREKIKTLKEAQEFAVENLDVLALGLKEEDIYLQSKKETRYYSFAFEIAKKFTNAELRAIYDEPTPGKLAANFLQYADILHPQLPEYLSAMPSVMPVALEQDPHMHAVRDVAQCLPYEFVLPSSIYILHQSGLKEGKKMSASEPDTAIFLTDTPEDAKRKIYRTFTGGGETLQEQREKGGKPEVCKVFEILKYHHPDTGFVEKIFAKCKSGELICGECKKMCADFIAGFLEDHKKKYEKAYEKVKEIVFGY